MLDTNINNSELYLNNYIHTTINKNIQCIHYLGEGSPHLL